MGKVFFLSCFLFVPFLIFSQEIGKKTDSVPANRVFLDVSGGLSFPLGAYANTDVNNSGSGFAARGVLAQINLDWLGKNDFGLAVQYSFQRNPLKSSVRNDTLSGMGQALGTGAWTNNYLMAGLAVVKFIHKVYIEGRALIGIVLSSSPVFRTMDPVYKTLDSNTGTGFAYGLQVGAGYAVSPRVTVKANIEYLACNPAIHHQYGAQVIGTDSITGRFIYSAPISFDTKITVSSLFVKAGLVFKLSK
jgi:hypothetical protein